MSNGTPGSNANKKPVRVAGDILLFRRDSLSNRGDIIQAQKSYFEARARMAATLIEKWGMVAADIDGEDSSGRAKGRVLTPSEVVSRACTTADLAFSEFERRGWVHEIPVSFVFGEDSGES